jgi:hypothetical protein
MGDNGRRIDPAVLWGILGILATLGTTVLVLAWTQQLRVQISVTRSAPWWVASGLGALAFLVWLLAIRRRHVDVLRRFRNRFSDYELTLMFDVVDSIRHQVRCRYEKTGVAETLNGEGWFTTTETILDPMSHDAAEAFKAEYKYSFSVADARTGDPLSLERDEIPAAARTVRFQNRLTHPVRRGTSLRIKEELEYPLTQFSGDVEYYNSRVEAPIRMHRTNLVFTGIRPRGLRCIVLRGHSAAPIRAKSLDVKELPGRVFRATHAINRPRVGDSIRFEWHWDFVNLLG